jgi:uncharacterized protein YidB (DUF937 family)
MLPKAIDTLSPGGQLPQIGGAGGGQDLGALLGSLLR